MRPFCLVTLPDERIVARIAALLRTRPGAASFVGAGHALAAAVVATRGTSDLPEWAEDLADVMVGALLPVRANTEGDEDAVRRVRLATAAAVLSTVRPRVAARCDVAIADWLEGVGPIRRVADASALAELSLLSLLLDDAERAAEAVDVLADVGDIGLVLYDWAVTRLQRHGQHREALCFHNLRLSLGGGDPVAAPAVLVLAAIASAERHGLGRDRVLDWLDEVAVDVATAGTSARTAAG